MANFSGNAIIDSLLAPTNRSVSPAESWLQNNVTGQPLSLTYDWMTAAPAGAPANPGTFTAFNAAQQASAVVAMGLVSEVANVTFARSAVGTAQIEYGNIALSTTPFGFTAGLARNQYTIPSVNGVVTDTYIVHSDVYLTNTPNTDATLSNPFVGTSGFSTMLHEVLHALGFDHSFENNQPPAGTDSHQYSVMSYTSHPSMPNVSPTGLMLYDMVAIQYLYGANTTTRTGNDVYSWATNAAPLTAIWDAGGVDTLSAAGQNFASVINLNSGFFSSIGSNGAGGAAVNNIAIAYGATIENAIGGNGNDAIYGNAGNNNIAGGTGHDYVDGGAGSDTIDYSGGTNAAYVELYLNRAVNDGSGFYDSLLNIENVTGTSMNDFVLGDGGNNILIGNAGSDSIFASWGNDYIVGGTGGDYMVGSVGFDQFAFSAADFAAGVWDSVNDFKQIANDFDYLRFIGLTAADMQMVDFNGNVIITTNALNYAGGIVVYNATVADLADQLIYS